ncbi:hypothetical protein FACS1894147_03430 [Spirochaetia bacterium]|nr:hypothetical protein FACS1894147_03430 [Spirochaetia bacterium]
MEQIGDDICDVIEVITYGVLDVFDDVCDGVCDFFDNLTSSIMGAGK